MLQVLKNIFGLASATDFKALVSNGAQIIDVRTAGEFQSGHIKGAINIPLNYINENMAAIEKHKTYYVHCAGGYRSVIFISILNYLAKFLNIIGTTFGLERTFLNLENTNATRTVEINHPISTKIKNK